MAKKIIEKKYSVREVEKIVKKYSEKVEKKSEKKEKNNENVVKLDNKEVTENYDKYNENDDERVFIEEKLREFFETKVSIKGDLQKQGKIEIDFFDYEDLSRIISLLNIEFE